MKPCVVVASLVSAAVAVPFSLLRAQERQLLRQRERAREHAALRNVRLPPDQWFNQTLDHFNVLNVGTWQQRFWTNTQYYNGSGVVFLYIEGEGTGSPYDVVEGQHVELAASFGALLVSLEHRFYGASQPTGDWSEASLAYLSSHQAIADIASFVTGYVLPTYSLNVSTARIVTFGGSYPGALSAWARLRLPHLVTAALSTSSPVRAVADFTGYNDVVAASLSNPLVGGSPACVTAMSNAFAAATAGLSGSPAQRAAASLALKSCAAAVTDADAMNVASNAAGQIMGVVQYNDEEGGPNVASTCAIMLNASYGDPLQALGAAIGATLTPAPCMDNAYDDFIALIRNTTADPRAQGVGLRQWTWQTCSQFGYYQTCEVGTACPFSPLMTLDFSFQICVDAFDARVAGPANVARIDFTNAYLGATDVATSRIIFTNGGIDPWHALSVTPALNNNASNVALFIPDGAHCRQMLPSRADDPADVKAARAAALATLQAWLA